MLTLPSDSRFDLWRDNGADLLAAAQEVLDAPQMPAGDHPFSTQLVLGFGVTRGTLDAQGHRITDLRFTKSLFNLFGSGTSGPSGSPGYSWPSGSGKGALVKCPSSVRHILMNLNIVLPDRTMPAHHQESGFHGIWSDKTSQLILLNVGIYNAENALILGGSHSHAKGIYIGTRGTRPANGDGMKAHYATCLQGEDNAIEDLVVDFNSYHDVGVQGGQRNAYVRYTLQKGVHDFHATSKTDEVDDDNLYAFGRIAQVHDRLFHETGADSNKPWTGERPTFYDLRKTDGTLIPSSSFPTWLKSRAVIIPVSDPLPPPEEPPMFVVGDRVKATSLLIIRSGPAKSFPQVGSQAIGAVGSVTEGEVLDSASGFIYVKVNFDSGVDGYCGIDKLEKVVGLTARQRAKQKLMSENWQPFLSDEADVVVNL